LQYLVRNKIALVSFSWTAELYAAMRFGRPQSTLYLILLTRYHIHSQPRKGCVWVAYRGGLCSDVGLPRKGNSSSYVCMLYGYQRKLQSFEKLKIIVLCFAVAAMLRSTINDFRNKYSAPLEFTTSKYIFVFLLWTTAGRKRYLFLESSILTELFRTKHFYTCNERLV
jgi:hypothetical protein